MRLGIDAGNFARDRRGMGRVARGIAHALLDETAFETTFLLERPRDEAGVRDAFAGRTIAVQPASTAARPGAYDVVWFPWNGMRYGSKAPALVTVNDAFAFAYPHSNAVARAREQDPIRRGAREARGIVTCSNWSRGEIVRFLSVEPARIDVVGYAPDPMFRPGTEDPLMRAWRFLLLVGVREERKNARIAIEASARAFTRATDTLAIVGDLSTEDARLLRRLGVRHRLLGSVDDQTLRTLYCNARAVAVPSLAEGFGLVAIEAMACGTAVLAADASALPEATQGGALLLDPSSASAWSDAIDRVFRDDAFTTALASRGFGVAQGMDPARPGAAYAELLRGLAAA